MFSPKCLIELFLKSNRSIDKTSYQAERSIVELVRRPAAPCGPSGRMRPKKPSLRNHGLLEVYNFTVFRFFLLEDNLSEPLFTVRQLNETENSFNGNSDFFC